MTSGNLRSNDIALALGSTIIEIRVRFGRVELRAYNEERYQTFKVTINRMIAFTFDGARGVFDPGMSTHNPSQESGNFVFLIGKSIESIIENDSGLSLTLSGSAEIFIAVDASDFEPIIFSAVDEGRKALLFEHVW